MSTALKKKTLYSIHFWSLIFVLGFEQAWCQPQAWWHSPIILVTSAAEQEGLLELTSLRPAWATQRNLILETKTNQRIYSGNVIKV